MKLLIIDMDEQELVESTDFNDLVEYVGGDAAALVESMEGERIIVYEVVRRIPSPSVNLVWEGDE